jgi:hypothetical protein
LQNFSNQTNSESVIIPRDDETEALRLRDTNGYGDIILDDQAVRSYHLTDMGIGFPPDEDFR